MPVFQLPDEIIFPPSELAEPNGLLGVGGDLSIERLITAPRLILVPDELRVSKRLQRYYRSSGLTITINTCFDQVVKRCATIPRKEGDGTWITGDMARAYQELHRRHYAHSVECWLGTELVGGLYGVALGQVFFGESMFSALSNCSKFALIHLVDFLKSNDYRLIDCQMTTDHLVSLGAREIPGAEFRRLLSRYITSDTHNGAWPHEKINEHGTLRRLRKT